MDALGALRTYLDRKEPQLIRVLARTWKNQQDAITYAEIRQMILSGTISVRYLLDWQQDYAQLLAEKIMPMLHESIAFAAATTMERYDYRLDFAIERMQEYIERHSAELVVQITDSQMAGLQAIVTKAATLGDLSVDEMSRVIRPTVGLYPQQSVAVGNYYATLRQKRSAKDAQTLAINYASRLHRYRAMMIARTELAFAYNNGNDRAMRQAQNEGLIGDYRKKWATADDERVCDRCGPLDGVTIGKDELFIDSTGHAVLLPPLHPHCRCAVEYVLEE